MERWEYAIVDISRLWKDVGELNRLGAEGWEAVEIVSTGGARKWRFSASLDPAMYEYVRRAVAAPLVPLLALLPLEERSVERQC
jgi:hypothetical protein